VRQPGLRVRLNWSRSGPAWNVSSARQMRGRVRARRKSQRPTPLFAGGATEGVRAGREERERDSGFDNVTGASFVPKKLVSR